MILFPGGRCTCTGLLSKLSPLAQKFLPIPTGGSSVQLVTLYLTAIVGEKCRHWSSWSSTATCWTCGISISHLMLEWLIWLILALLLFYAKLNSQIRLRFRLRPDLEKWNPVHPYFWHWKRKVAFHYRWGPYFNAALKRLEEKYLLLSGFTLEVVQISTAINILYSIHVWMKSYTVEHLTFTR